MDSRRILVIGFLLVLGQASAYFNQTYDGYSFVLADVNAENNPFEFAQNWCQSNRYSLVTITDKDVQGYVNQFINSAIGNGQMNTYDQIIMNGRLYFTLPGAWMWSNGHTRSGVSIQDEMETSQHYYYAYLRTTDFKLHASKHSIERFFICEYPGDTNCADGLALNGRCYKRSSTSLTWYSARNDCIDRGGDIASFENLNDNTFNATLGPTLLAGASAIEFWVGMQHVEWRWADTGLAIKYTHWESGSPFESVDCLCLRLQPRMSDWMWFSIDCGTSNRFICMRYEGGNPPPSTVAKTTSTGNDNGYLPTSTVAQDGKVSDSDPKQPSSATSPTQPASGNSNGGIGVGVGVGIGVGIGVGVLAIVLVIVIIVIIRQQRNKKRQDDDKPVADAVQETSVIQQGPPAYSVTSDRSNDYSSVIDDRRSVRTTTTDSYEPLHHTNAWAESLYEQPEINQVLE